MRFLFLLLAIPVFANAELYQIDMERIGDKIAEFMQEEGVDADHREEVVALAEELLRLHPGNSGSHYLMGLVHMAVKRGDIAMKYATKACEMDDVHCAHARGWMEQINEAFSTCIDNFDEILACELTNFSGDSLSKTLRGMYFTNRSEKQEYIGRLKSIKHEKVTLEITWANKKSGFKKGQVKVLNITQIKKLREGKVSAEAIGDGWK